jgi:hypothetical protein
MDKAKVDRLGPGDWSTYVEFDEFDGGDGQMGVAGDGKKVRDCVAQELETRDMRTLPDLCDFLAIGCDCN